MEYKTIGNVQLQPVVLESKGLPLRLELEEVIFFSHIHPKITTLMIDELNEDGAIARFLNNRLNYLSNSKLHKPDDYAKLRENPLYIVREHPNECPLTLDMISPDEERIGTKFLKWVEEFKKSSLTYLKEKKIRVPIFSPFMGQGAYGTSYPIIQANYGFYPLDHSIKDPVCRDAIEGDCKVSHVNLLDSGWFI